MQMVPLSSARRPSQRTVEARATRLADPSGWVKEESGRSTRGSVDCAAVEGLAAGTDVPGIGRHDWRYCRAIKREIGGALFLEDASPLTACDINGTTVRGPIEPEMAAISGLDRLVS
jgi:hypothetical protein